MEIDTAVRHGAKVVFIVSNNSAWNIECLDQELNYGGRVVGRRCAIPITRRLRARWEQLANASKKQRTFRAP
jgi:thiamine pyrophosphate-dependent acetolactate synthase large subunit-like protein